MFVNIYFTCCLAKSRQKVIIRRTHNMQQSLRWCVLFTAVLKCHPRILIYEKCRILSFKTSFLSQWYQKLLFKKSQYATVFEINDVFLSAVSIYYSNSVIRYINRFSFSVMAKDYYFKMSRTVIEIIDVFLSALLRFHSLDVICESFRMYHYLNLLV